MNSHKAKFRFGGILFAGLLMQAGIGEDAVSIRLGDIPTSEGELTGDLTGKVTDEVTGAPIINLTLVLTSEDLFETTTDTDFQGRYLIPDLFEGDYLLDIISDSYSLPEPIIVSIVAGQNTNQDIEPMACSPKPQGYYEEIAATEKDAIVEFDFTDGSIQGSIPIGDTDSFLVGASIELVRANVVEKRTVVYAGELFRFTGLAEGMYTVRGASDDFDILETEVNVVINDIQEVVLRGEPKIATLGAIVGLVTESDSGDPISMARVTARLDGFGSGNISMSTFTNIEGVYALPAVVPGSYIVGVAAEGFVSETGNSGSVPAGGAVEIDFQVLGTDSETEGEGQVVEGEEGGEGQLEEGEGENRQEGRIFFPFTCSPGRNLNGMPPLGDCLFFLCMLVLFLSRTLRGRNVNCARADQNHPTQTK